MSMGSDSPQRSHMTHKIKKIIFFSMLTSIIVLPSSVFAAKVFVLYDDYWHYQPSGWMAEGNNISALSLNSFSPVSPAQGIFCARVSFDSAIALWAGFYIQASEKWRADGGVGIDLSGYTTLKVKARAATVNDTGVQIRFGVGGDTASATNADSCNVQSAWQTLGTDWTEFSLDLTGQNLSDINGLAKVVLGRLEETMSTVYMDDIRFVGPGPDQITDLRTVVGGAPGTIKLKWTSPQGDFNNARYVLKYSKSPIITKLDFDNALTYDQTWIPASPGSIEEKTITGLDPGEGYNLALQTIDEQGNVSNISNVFYTIAITVGVGIKAEGIIDLGGFQPGEAKVSPIPITVTNIGGVPTTYSLNLSVTTGWTASVSNLGIGKFILLGAFATSPNNIVWNIDKQSILSQPKKCTSEQFAGDQTGANVPPGETRLLWIRFSAPYAIWPNSNTQIIYVNVTGETTN